MKYNAYASSKVGVDKIVSETTEVGGTAVAIGGDMSRAADAQGLLWLSYKKAVAASW